MIDVDYPIGGRVAPVRAKKEPAKRIPIPYMAFYNAWHWLRQNHEWSIGNLTVEVVLVHSKLKRIVEDDAKNTLLNFWLEGGPYVNEAEMGIISSHDYRLDCGGDTFEDAIIKYSKLVRRHYGEETDMMFGKKARKVVHSSALAKKGECECHRCAYDKECRTP